MITSTARLSWVTPAPISPGSMRRSSTRICGVRRGRGSDNPMPARCSAHSSSPSCATPDAVIPQDSAWPAVGT